MRHKLVPLRRIFVFFPILILFMMGCDIFREPVRAIVDILDEAIDSLENQSGGWQAILQDTIKELEANGHALVKNDVAKVLTQATQDLGVEVRCTADFMRDRVKEDLIRLRATFTGEILELVPVFCVPNPPSIDFAFVKSGDLTSIDIDGYNLDAANIKVYLVDNQNQRVDVSSKLANPTRYLVTLNLGSNGVPLTPQSDRIEFEFPPTSSIQTVNINQPRPVEQFEVVQPPSIERLCPRQVGGDKEFDGHGPDVSASAKLYISENGRELWVRIELNAKETKSDWSEARGRWDMPVWPGKIDSKITGFTPDSASTTEYRDTNHQEDTPTISGSALVQRFEINGDTEDDDIGNCTIDDVYMNVFFNPVQVSYIKEQ